MSYTYRPAQTKPTIQSNTNIKPASTKPVRQLTKQQLKMYQSVLLIMGYVTKSNQNKKIKQAFNKVKTHVAKRKKYSQLLSRKLNYLFKQKQKQFTSTFFSCLISNKISFYNAQMATQKSIKQTTKTRATGILFYSIQKLMAKKSKMYFNDLRAKSIEYSKARIFKATHVFARLSAIYRRKLSQSLTQISKNRFRIIKINKICSKLENFVSAKNRRNISSVLNVIKLAFYKLKQSGAGISEFESNGKSTIVKSPRGVGITNQPSILVKQQSAQQQKRELQTRQRQLQAQLTQIQQSSQSTLTSLKNDINRLQKQTQSLKFNNQLLEQNNTQLESQLQLLLLKNRRKLPRNEIWQNVYNNLIYFLSINRNKNITKQQLIEAMELPLVPCGVNMEEINEENKVLEELLQEYKRSFPEPQRIEGLENQMTLPYDLLKRKNKYYYMVLEVLAEWGGAGSRELQQLNKDLELLQKRLCQV